MSISGNSIFNDEELNFNITINVTETTYTNTKSLKFADGVNSYLGGNAALVTALERSGNGSGSSEAWSIGKTERCE